jgi:hypothetical protein
MRRTTSSLTIGRKQLDDTNQCRQGNDGTLDLRQCVAVGLIEHPSGQNATRAIGQSGNPFLLPSAVTLPNNLKLHPGMWMVAVAHPLEFRDICIV